MVVNSAYNITLCDAQNIANCVVFLYKMSYILYDAIKVIGGKYIMAKETIDLRKELRSYKYEFGLLQKIPCSKQENKQYQKLLKDGGVLPEGVFAYLYDDGVTSSTEFYTIYETDLTETEVTEYLTYKKLSFIRTIKNCIMFFTVLTIIGMIAYFSILMDAM